MSQLLKGVLVGIGSAAVTYVASLYALSYTTAFALPRGFPIDVWLAVVVFGLGAFLVALVVHLLAVRAFSPRLVPALLAFLVTSIASLAVAGLLSTGIPALASWMLGALLASIVHGWLRSNRSVKPDLLRGSSGSGS